MSERRCILTGDRAAPGALIRLAISPDGLVLPDVRAKAPGRGAWVGVPRAELELALSKGRLRGALARAFKGADLIVPVDLPAQVDGALRGALLDRLGLESRSSTLITGFDRIDTAARRGTVRLLMHASDAGQDGMRKLDQAWRVGEGQEGTNLGGIRLPVDRNTLSVALGRDNVVHIAMIDARAGARVRSLLDRWQCYLGCDELDRGETATGEAQADMSVRREQETACTVRAGAEIIGEGSSSVNERE
jgi:predicted RNA-binding protein YlxR (DUF448 family)